MYRKLAIAFFASLLICSCTLAQQTNHASGARTNSESAPLSDVASARTVWVRNKEGKGIANVQVIVDYDSERHPPVFVTDSEGKAVVKVKEGFWALRIDAGGGAGVRMTIFPSQVEWPCEVILPTRKTKF